MTLVRFLEHSYQCYYNASIFDGKVSSIMTARVGAPCISYRADCSEINNITKVCGAFFWTAQKGNEIRYS